MSITPQIRPIAQRKNSLCPSTETATTLAPVPAINGLCLTAPSSAWMLDYQIDPAMPDYASTWATTYRALSPDDSWLDLVEVLPLIEREAQIPADLLWTAFQLRKPEPRLVQLLPQLPAPLLSWMKTKKVGAADLLPLLSLPETAGALSVLDLFTPELESLSKQDGVRALELWIELSLSGQPAESLARSTSETSAQWIDRLKAIRFPRSSAQDQTGKTWLDQQSWPRGLNVKFQRQGDQSGIELKVTVRRPQDLQQLSKNIEQLGQKLQDAPDSLWPKA